MSDKLKTGRLSIEDIDYITKNAHKPIEELAAKLQRTPDIIGKYIRLNAGETNTKDAFGAKETQLDITKLPFWTNIIAQFNVDEQNQIKFEWNRLVEQFMGDVTPTEQMQIVDLVKLDALLNRLLTDRQKVSIDIENYQEMIEEERNKDMEERSVEMMLLWEQSLANLRASMDVGTKQIKDYLAEKNKLMDKLKGTRDQRLKVLENTKENFPQWLQKLMRDTKMQDSLGQRMAKLSLAKEEERKRLSEYHTFEDGMVDRPFLTPDVVLREKEDEQNTNT